MSIHFLRYFLAILISTSLLFAPPANDAVISTNTVSTTTGIYYETSSVVMSELQSGTTPIDFVIDLYSWSSRNKAVDLLFQTTPVLSDGLGHTIPMTYSFTPTGGTVIPIVANNWFNVLSNGSPSYRDGMTSPGFISLSIGPIPDNQVAGDYSASLIPIDVQMDGITSAASGFLSINTTVGAFIVIGFADTSLDKLGVKFVGEAIDFGSLTPYVPVPPITKNVFVHTNRNTDIQLTFQNTPALLSTVDVTSTLPITYTYNLDASSGVITAGVPFVAVSGPSDGATNVGSITFAPDTPTTNQSAGGYTATVNIVVSAL